MNTRIIWKKACSLKSRAVITAMFLVLAFAWPGNAITFTSPEDFQRRMREQIPEVCKWLHDTIQIEQFKTPEELCRSFKEINLLKVDFRGERSRTSVLIFKDQYEVPYLIMLMDQTKAGYVYVDHIELAPGEGIVGGIDKKAILSFYKESLIIKRLKTEGDVKKTYVEIWSLENKAFHMMFRALLEEVGPAGGMKCKLKYGPHFPFNLKIKGYTYSLGDGGKEKKTGKIKDIYQYRAGAKKYEKKK